MERDHIETLIDNLAAAFLMLDGDTIDVPSAGKLLNATDELLAEAQRAGMEGLAGVVRETGKLLESIVLERVDPARGAALFADSITAMQSLARDPGEVPPRSEAPGSNDDQGCLASSRQDREAQEASAGVDIPARDDLDRDDSLLPEEGEREKSPPEEESEEPFIVQDESLLKDFITESLEYIGEIEINILNLEQNPQDRECINAVFRPFHSIKGVSSFLDLGEIRDIAHELETLLDRARSGELSVDSSIIDIVLEGADTLKAMIESLQEILDGTRSRPLSPDLSYLREKIAAVDAMGGGGEAVKEPAKKLGAILVEDGIISEDLLEETLRKPVDPSRRIGERLISDGKATPKHVLDALRKQSKQVAETTTVRVDVKKLDDFVDMIGELVITQTMIKQALIREKSTDRKLMGDVAQLSSITSELQRTSTSLRMVPIRQTFQRMARLARDVAKSIGKDVVVEMNGEETEIDRNMVEEIYNPLVHMVRNAVDHGLENREERVASGKGERGTVRLSAYHKGGSIVIEITDDGRGLNARKILRKARERGLVGESEEPGEQELYRMLFMAGFSTAERVTDVSGRGVGMDVVRQAVEKLRGKVEIRSVEGRGTTVAAFFPLTMAIIDGMMVKVGTEKYIIPATAIRRLLRPEESNYTRVTGKGEMLNVMGELLPLVRLYEVFSVAPQFREPWDALVVVVDAGNRSKCILVDEVLEKGEVVIKSLGGNFGNLEGISGGAIMGDGSVGLILDPEGLFELSERIAH